ncbi:gamma-butyrobetaine dioxygenase [Methylobacterium sp. PvP062]|uniref:trimethyllysine dioxygenase n=1 Tax=Methylobacterium radiotolerans TaxID=31998 RepID=A0ABV2NT96_9HYPH|nr:MULTISPECIES: TauD/TfdA family dioxygenase [unclassified Methylobacterium]MBP2498982.1 gamma-butyrobetaine dioxygenase [Methylobacterium sp. PvP105]MBP2505518.1 gamma-butyrobetaine dioxygenase [Methylobacterium sp. PvP109]
MIKSETDHLSIEWQDGQLSRYHWVWLRDNCHSDVLFNASCNQKYYDTAFIPLDVVPTSTTIKDGDLHITWSDNHSSVYDLEWLRANDYSRNTAAYDIPAGPSWKPWTDDLPSSMAAFDQSAVMNDRGALKNLLEHLFEHGIVVAKAGSAGGIKFEDLVRRISGFLQPSYFGDYFDLKTKPDDQTDSISFSTKELHLHTDIPYYSNPPEFQFLFGLDVSDGCAENNFGNTRFIDGLEAANSFQKSEKNLYEVLCNEEVIYIAEYPEAQKLFVNSTPIIKRNAENQITGLINNPSKMFFKNTKFNEMPRLYEAYSKFKKSLLTKSPYYTHKWHQDDLLIWDNRRIFHGRDAFNSGTHTRILRGGYFGKNELEAKLYYASKKEETSNA